MMTTTRNIISIQFVLVLATVIGIHGKGSITLREATLAIKSNFEDGLSDREFKVEYPGIAGLKSATIKIFRKEDGESGEPKLKYTFTDGVSEAKTLYFELKEKDAPAGSYEVQVCGPAGKCSARRAAFGEILDEESKPALSCSQGDSPFERLDKGTTDIKIKAGEKFLTPAECDGLPTDITAYSMLKLKSNPTYGELNGRPVFYSVVWYDGKHLSKLFETIAKEGYCSRKYIFWASAHVVDKASKVVKRRFRGTIIVNKNLADRYILDSSATSFPVEFVRYDDEKPQPGKYEVSISFCATDKDRINSSVCSQAIYSDLTI